MTSRLHTFLQNHPQSSVALALVNLWASKLNFLCTIDPRLFYETDTEIFYVEETVYISLLDQFLQMEEEGLLTITADEDWFMVSLDVTAASSRGEIVTQNKSMTIMMVESPLESFYSNHSYYSPAAKRKWQEINN